MRRPVDDPALLGTAWDALETGDEAPMHRDADFVRELHAMAEDELPGPSAALISRMWADALEQASARPATAPAARRILPARLGIALATVATAMAAGFMAGAIAGGLGARLAMRLAGALTPDRNRGLLTEAGNQVGRTTLGGTAELVLFTGLIGALGAVLYLALRWLSPWAGWRRGLLFGGVLFALGGADILERGTNPDYQRFGVAGLNVCLFSLLPVLYGLLLAPLADRWTRRAAAWGARTTSAWPLTLVPFTVLAGFAVLSGVRSMPLLLPLVLAGAVRGLLWWRPELAELRPPAIPPRWLQAATYGAVAVPCLIGLAQTAIAIGRILG